MAAARLSARRRPGAPNLAPWALSLLALSLGACSGGDRPPDASAADAGPRDASADAGADASPILSDPHSMPLEPTLSGASFTSSTVCGGCHSTHYQEWQTSMHAYSMVDPVYRALVGLRQAEFDGAQDKFCLQCHSAIATRGGEIVPNFAFEELSPIAIEGITCEACHKVSGMERSYNSGHILDPDGPIRGPIMDPAASAHHESEYSPLFESPQFCGGCHDVIEASGVPLERPYDEWLESPANPDGPTCQTCHMPTYRGVAAFGAPERDLHRHRFIGVDLPLSPTFIDPAEEAALAVEIRDLLGTAAALELRADSRRAGERIDLLLSIRNLISGHNLPTGSTFLRQTWVEVVVTDAAGITLYETGTLDANGDLRDHFSELEPYADADLISLGSRFVDARGEPTVLSWHAAEHVSNAIPPLQERTHTLFIPTAGDTLGPLTIRARLRFRTHPPFLLRLLGLDSLLDRVQTYDLASATLDVDLLGP